MFTFEPLKVLVLLGLEKEFEAVKGELLKAKLLREQSLVFVEALTLRLAKWILMSCSTADSTVCFEAIFKFISASCQEGRERWCALWSVSSIGRAARQGRTFSR